MKENIAKSDLVKQAADIFVKEKKIKDTLGKWGEVIFTGSYFTNLMVWNDIDIILVLPKHINSLDSLSAISRACLEDPDVKSVKMINFTPGKIPGAPVGVYLGIYYQMLSSKQKWKVDIWSLQDKDLAASISFNNYINSNLTPNLRELILKLKFDLMADGKRVPSLCSYCIYQAIFNENLRDEEQILHYLANKGVLAG